MACDERLVKRVRAALGTTCAVAELRMLGGVCFTINGNMVCGVVDSDLMVRVGPDRYAEALERPHARAMDFTGRPMRGYVFVAAAGTKTEASLKSWVQAGVAYTGKLPPKARTSRQA